MKRYIKTFEIPVVKRGEAFELDHENKKEVGSEEVELETAADIQRLAIEIGQGNTRDRQIAMQVLGEGGKTTITERLLV